MKTDRSGRTFEEYRQLYWDGQKRIDELEERLKFNQENHDALVARWEPHIAELEAQVFDDQKEFMCYASNEKRLKAKLDAVKNVKTFGMEASGSSDGTYHVVQWAKWDDVLAALGEAK